MIDFRLGRYQDVLQDVECDAVICDPPYSKGTHDGHSAGVKEANNAGYNYRNDLAYNYWTEEDVDSFLSFWKLRCSGWFAVMSDHDLSVVWRRQFAAHGLYSFVPIPCTMPGMTVRLMGDGPSNWTIWLLVARPKSHSKWGALPGVYAGPAADRGYVVGSKPKWLMNAIIRDYSKPNDLICDPCSGGATTLIAAASQGRRAVGCEMDADTYAKAKARIDAGYTQDMFVA